MSFYDELALDADLLLQEFGAPATLTRTTLGPRDPATGTAGSVTVSADVRAAVFDYATRLVDGTLIQLGDKQALLSVVGLTLVPAPSDVFAWQGLTYQVVRVVQTAPAGQAVLYDMQVRRA